MKYHEMPLGLGRQSGPDILIERFQVADKAGVVGLESSPGSGTLCDQFVTDQVGHPDDQRGRQPDVRVGVVCFDRRSGRPVRQVNGAQLQTAAQIDHFHAGNGLLQTRQPAFLERHANTEIQASLRHRRHLAWRRLIAGRTFPGRNKDFDLDLITADPLDEILLG